MDGTISSIWILTIEHDNDRDMYAFISREGARQGLFRFVDAWWDTECEDVKRPLNKDGSIDEDLMIEQYFDHLEGREWYLIEEVTLSP